MKFGGALMSNAEGIRRVADLVKEFSPEPLVVVVSAVGKTTNALEILCANAEQNDFSKLKQEHLKIYSDLFPDGNNQLLDKLNDLFGKLQEAISESYDNRYEAYDNIVSYGEELSSCLVFHYLIDQDIPVRLINAKCLISTDSNYTDAAVNWSYTEKTIESRVIPSLDKGEVVVTQGFIGSDTFGKSTTLGREGSDFTAAIFGNILDADEVTIWKNVPGLMNADPSKFDDAVKIDSISYHEAIELAYYGASVIHPKTIQPLKEKNIPLFVRPYDNLSAKPTSITNDNSNDGNLHSIIVKENQVLLSIGTKNLSFIGENNLKQIFEVFSRNKVHINLMQNSAVSFSVCFNEDKVKLDAIQKELNKDYTLKYNTGLKLITVRHYTDELVDELIGETKVYLVQKSRVTTQVLVKE